MASHATSGICLLAVALLVSSCVASPREAMRERHLDSLCRLLATETQKDADWVSSCKSRDRAVVKSGLHDYFSARPQEACKMAMLISPGLPARTFIENIARETKVDCQARAATSARAIVNDMSVAKMCLRDFMPDTDPVLKKEITKTIKSRKINCDNVLAIAIPNHGAAQVGAPSFNVLPDGSKVLSVKTR